jgi:endo-1,4-beta-xylanase
MAVRGHTLVWHQQAPVWATAAGRTPAEIAAILEEHIKAVAGRYAGKVYAWDVVNEAVEKDGSWRTSPWSALPGYVEQAFRWARGADPRAKLFYNDYDAEEMNPKSDRIYSVLKDFRSRGVPVDGVGMQMHFTSKPLPLASIEANMKRLTALGLEVQITELDVRLPLDSSGQAASADLGTQAARYREIVSLCMKFPKCTAIQTWGVTDRYSWVPGYFKGTGAALLFDRDYRPKPAYEAIRDVLSGR